MVLALQLNNVYREFILGFDRKNALVGSHIALLNGTLMSTWFSVLPGLAPAGEALFFWEKVPKPLTPRLASSKRRDASFRRADQLAESILSFVEGLKQGPPADGSVPPLGHPAGVGPWETNLRHSVVNRAVPWSAVYYFMSGGSEESLWLRLCFFSLSSS